MRGEKIRHDPHKALPVGSRHISVCEATGNVLP
jgi:hypothetical protein